MSDTNSNRPSHRLFNVTGDGDNARVCGLRELVHVVRQSRLTEHRQKLRERAMILHRKLAPTTRREPPFDDDSSS